MLESLRNRVKYARKKLREEDPSRAPPPNKKKKTSVKKRLAYTISYQGK